MAARILEGTRINEGEGSGAVFYDSTEGRAYGPVFDDAESAERFLSYLAGMDPGRLSWGPESFAEHLYTKWLKEGKPDKRPVVQFDKDYLYEDEEEGTWHFSVDLVEACFPLFNQLSNNEVGKLLKRKGVLLQKPDTEHSCVYVDFKTETEGEAFLERLNTWLRTTWESL